MYSFYIKSDDCVSVVKESTSMYKGGYDSIKGKKRKSKSRFTSRMFVKLSVSRGQLDLNDVSVPIDRLANGCHWTSLLFHWVPWLSLQSPFPCHWNQYGYSSTIDIIGSIRSFGQWLAIIETIINSLFHRVSRTLGRNPSIQTQGSSPWKISSWMSKSVFRSVQNHCSWFKEWQSEPKTRPWSEKYDNWNLSFWVSILWGAVTSSHLMKISKVKTPSGKVTHERDPPV